MVSSKRVVFMRTEALDGHQFGQLFSLPQETGSWPLPVDTWCVCAAAVVTRDPCAGQGDCLEGAPRDLLVLSCLMPAWCPQCSAVPPAPWRLTCTEQGTEAVGSSLGPRTRWFPPTESSLHPWSWPGHWPQACVGPRRWSPPSARPTGVKGVLDVLLCVTALKNGNAVSFPRAGG